MKKKVFIIIALIILVITGTVVIFIRTQDGDIPVVDESDKKASVAETIAIRDIVNKIESSTKSVNTVIPEFQNLESRFKDRINLEIYNELNETNVYADATEGFEEEEIGFFTYEVNYDRYNSDKYISIVASQYIHLGVGRPRMQKKCYVVNAEENTSMLLMDVFKNQTNYKNSILEEINSQAAKQEIELVGGNGVKELADNQAFYIKDNKLIIYFEASEIAATAVGELEFIMPFEMIDGKFVI